MIEAMRLFIRLTRPLAAGPFAFAFIAGALLSNGIIPPGRLIAYTAVIVFGLAGGAFILNSYTDRAIDRANGVTKDIAMREQPFATGELTPAVGLTLTGILFTGTLAAMAFVSLAAFYTTLALIILAVIYSFPPRLKTRPPLDIITNAAAAGAVATLGVWLGQPAAAPPWLIVVWVALLVAAAYLLTLLIDEPSDRKSGVRTSAVAIGQRRTSYVSAAVFCTSLIAFGAVVANNPQPYDLVLLPGLVLGVIGYGKLIREPTATRAGRLMHEAARAAVAGALALVIVYSVLFYSLFR